MVYVYILNRLLVMVKYNYNYNSSFLYIIILVLVGCIFYLVYGSNNNNNNIKDNNKDIVVNMDSNNYMDSDRLIYPYSPVFHFPPPINTGCSKSSFENPCLPPLKDNPYIDTRLRNTGYNQIGILVRNEVDKHPIILPLMGRALQRGDKLQYYTISNSGNNNTKLPIKVNGKSCTSERGCNELYDGDEVYVGGYQNSFKATIYGSKTMEYAF